MDLKKLRRAMTKVGLTTASGLALSTSGAFADCDSCQTCKPGCSDTACQTCHTGQTCTSVCQAAREINVCQGVQDLEIPKV